MGKQKQAIAKHAGQWSVFKKDFLRVNMRGTFLAKVGRRTRILFHTKQLVRKSLT